MPVEPFIISFPGASVAEANRYAAGLGAALREIDPEVAADQRRDREDTQDFGATVAVMLGTAAATAAAKGVAAWLARHSGATIQISADGTVLASNLDSRDAARIAEVFSSRK